MGRYKIVHGGWCNPRRENNAGFFFWTNGHEIVPISMIENNTGCRADCKLYMALYIGLAMRSMDTVMDVEPAV